MNVTSTKSKPVRTFHFTESEAAFVVMILAAHSPISIKNLLNSSIVFGKITDKQVAKYHDDLFNALYDEHPMHDS